MTGPRFMPAPAHYRDGPIAILGADAAAWLVSATNVEAVFAARSRDIDRAVAEQVIALMRVATSATASDIGSTEVEIAPATKDFLTSSEAAHLIGISDRAVRLACQTGRLPAVRNGRSWLVDPDDAENYRRTRAA